MPRDVAELRRCLASLPEAVYPVLLQQRIVGPGSGVFLLVWDGELIAPLPTAGWEKPPAGGVSVYSESAPATPSCVERGRRLLQDFGWQGVAMLEFKTDGRTGRPTSWKSMADCGDRCSSRSTRASTSRRSSSPALWVSAPPGPATESGCGTAGGGVTSITYWRDFGTARRRSGCRRGHPRGGRS